ncbi:MAG: hypothetical protein OHK0057_27810 [Thermoflexibacter sp.]
MFSISSVVSLSTVVTIKKNNNINTISGSEAVEIAGVDFDFFANFDILLIFF